MLSGNAWPRPRTHTYSESCTLVSASSLCTSQYSNGPKKFQLGPRRNVPSTMSDDQRTTNPKRKMTISALRSLKV